MADRFDVIQFKKSQNDKTYAVRLGSAVQSKNGVGWNLYMDAFPAPVDGQFKFSIVPQREKKDDGETYVDGVRKGPPRDDLDEDVPF